MSNYPPDLITHLSNLLNQSPAEVELFLTEAIAAGFLAIRGDALVPTLPKGYTA